MINPFSSIEQLFYRLRSLLWDYPNLVWVREDSLYNSARRIYLVARPYSHFILAMSICVCVVYFAVNVSQFKVFASESNTLIEGVVVGIDEDGELNSLSKVNPLYPTLVQLERDLNEIIYEPLIRFEQDSTVTPVLAEEITIIQEGADYEFDIRDEVYWHDSTAAFPRPFNVEDVVRTLEIISEIQTPEGQEISYVQAVKQMAWERVGDNAIRICTTTPELQERLTEDLQNKKCSGVRGEKPILANFLELIAFKIMPAHLTNGLNGRNIFLPDPPINKRPIGTGSFKFSNVSSDSITLIRNDNYYGEIPNLSSIEFRLFEDRNAAINALQNGEIHTISTTSTESFREMGQYPQVRVYKSPVQSNQYWALYFNLRQDLDGNALGPEAFQDVRVRQAISSAINRDRILLTLLGIGEEAWGPIYKDSEYFNALAGWYRYDVKKAEDLLDAAGWELDPNIERRRKGNSILSFKLSYVDVPDRARVVDSIRQDLLEIGVEVVPDPWELEDLFAQVVSPKLFDTLLYGMNTFIDPDRYELFHSEQSLNLSSYEGSDETVVIENRETVRVARVDRLLDRARSFDPSGGKTKRKEDYLQFQELLAKDTPVVFLYHPQFLYYANSVVKDIDLKGATSLEERFRNISSWSLSIETW